MGGILPTGHSKNSRFLKSSDEGSKTLQIRQIRYIGLFSFFVIPRRLGSHWKSTRFSDDKKEEVVVAVRNVTAAPTPRPAPVLELPSPDSRPTAIFFGSVAIIALLSLLVLLVLADLPAFR